MTMQNPQIYQDYLTEKVQQMNNPKTHLIMEHGYYVISRIAKNGIWVTSKGTFELNEDLNLWIARPDGMDGQADRLHSKTFSGLKQAIRREFNKMIERDTVS